MGKLRKTIIELPGEDDDLLFLKFSEWAKKKTYKEIDEMIPKIIKETVNIIMTGRFRLPIPKDLDLKPEEFWVRYYLVTKEVFKPIYREKKEVRYIG